MRWRRENKCCGTRSRGRAPAASAGPRRLASKWRPWWARSSSTGPAWDRGHRPGDGSTGERQWRETLRSSNYARSNAFCYPVPESRIRSRGYNAAMNSEQHIEFEFVVKDFCEHIGSIFLSSDFYRKLHATYFFRRCAILIVDWARIELSVKIISKNAR